MQKIKILLAINQMAVGGSQNFFEGLNLPQDRIVFIHFKSFFHFRGRFARKNYAWDNVDRRMGRVYTNLA